MTAATPQVRVRVGLAALVMLVLLGILAPAAHATGEGRLQGASQERGQERAAEREQGRDGTGRPADRPPAHATSDAPEDRPPAHATSDAPEDRPPAHARARRSSARHGGREEPSAAGDPSEDGGTDGDAEADGEAVEPDRARPDRGPDGPSAGPTRPVPPDPGPGRPARDTPPGRAGDRPEPAPDPAQAPAPGTELDTDVVEETPRPAPVRASNGVDSPPPPTPASPVIVVAAPPAPATPGSGFFPAPGGDPAGDGADTGVGDADTGSPREDLQAAPAPRQGDRPTAPELTRRVVVPVMLLVAGLVYLLAQGRIDRRGQLLEAPVLEGTEHDDDVYDL